MLFTSLLFPQSQGLILVVAAAVVAAAVVAVPAFCLSLLLYIHVHIDQQRVQNLHLCEYHLWKAFSKKSAFICFYRD